jgi:hypothetical protein
MVSSGNAPYFIILLCLMPHRVLARISKVAVQNNFVGVETYFVGVVTCFWAWPQFSVFNSEELWCFIR